MSTDEVTTTMLYFAGLGILLIFSLWAQWSVKSAYGKYSKIRGSSGLTGAEAAREMLSRAGIANVGIEATRGMLTDHYDPRKKVIRLSEGVYNSSSLAAVGIACHEAGHAVQDARNYTPLVIRNAAVPMASFGSNTAFILIFVGLLLNSLGMAVIGLVLFAGVVFFQLVNLPVEFNASARAKEALVNYGIVSPGAEADGVSSVLNAAAMTYVAATATAVFQLLYFLMIVLNRR